MRPKISLLHPTFFREGGPSFVRNAWLESASDPDKIEYLFAVTSTDKRGLLDTANLDRIVVEPVESHSTSVRNWNALAERSTGDLLFVIADDLLPAYRGWDEEIDRLVGGFDPLRKAFAVKVDDNGDPTDVQLRHPLISRKHYARFGLWDKRFRGMWVDDDFTLSAFWKSRIIDGRHVRFIHTNPVLDDRVTPSVSFVKANTSEEYNFGKNQFITKWHPALRHTRVRLHSAQSPSTRLRRGQFLRSQEVIRLVWHSRIFLPLRRAYLSWAKL